MANPIATLQRTAAEYQKMSKKDQKRYITDLILNNALYILMLAFCIYTAIQRPNFLSMGSLGNLIVQVAAYLPMALGIAGCIVLTGTDLSAGRAVGLTAAITGAFLQRIDYANKMLTFLPEVTPFWMFVTLLSVVAIGAVIGLVNGFFVAKFSLHPFIVTLSTQLITYGIILWFFDFNNGAPIGGLDEIYRNFLGTPMFYMGNTPVPLYVLYAVLLTALMWFIWNKTVFGKNMFAVGSNGEAAKVSGVNVFLTTLWPAPCTAIPALWKASAQAPLLPVPAPTTSVTPSQPASSAVFPSSVVPVRSAASSWVSSCCVSSSSL